MSSAALHVPPAGRWEASAMPERVQTANAPASTATLGSPPFPAVERPFGASQVGAAAALCGSARIKNTRPAARILQDIPRLSFGSHVDFLDPLSGGFRG